MAVDVTVVRGYRDSNYFGSLNPQSGYTYYRGGSTGSPGISAHNQLLGLQGGTTSQYYHFNAAEHNELSVWLSQMSMDSAATQIEDIALYGNIYLSNDGDSSGGHEQRFIYWGDDTYIHEYTEDVLRVVCDDALVMTLEASNISAHYPIKVDTISELTGSAGISVTDVLKVDEINEYSGAAGVIIETVLINDGYIYSPATHSADLGSTTNYWNRLYVDDIYLKNTAGTTASHIYATSGDDLTFQDGSTGPHTLSDLMSAEDIWDRSSAGVISPATANDTLSIDQIDEWAGDAGVTIDGVLLKDDGITLGTGATVDTIEIALTDDDTHLPTSGAVYDAIAVGVGGKLDTSDRTIYIETTGDDDTGDGSIGNPFATILRALQDLGSILDPAIITVNFGIGTFQYDADCIVEFGRLKFFGSGARLYFQGTTNTVESGLTLTEQSGKEWRYDVSGATFTTDEHNENFLVIEDSVSLATFPIMGNGTATIDSFTGVEDATDIITLQTVIEFTELVFSPDVVGGRLRIKNIDCDATAAGVINYRIDNIHTVFRESILRIDTITTGYLYDGPELSWSNSLILTDNDTGYGVKSYGQLTVNKAGIRHDGSGSGHIAYGVSDLLETLSHSLFIQNYTWGIEVRKQARFAANDLVGGTGCVIFKDVTNAFGCSNNSTIHCGSEVDTTPPWMRTYIDNVDYVLCAREGEPYHGINVHINPLFGTPNTAYLHSVFDDFLDGMPSFNHNIIIDGYNLYASTYETTETAARTIYVTTTGNDVTGDGTSGTPYRQPLRAVQDVRNIVDDVTITISLGVGSFTWDNAEIELEMAKKQYLGGAILLFEGTPVLKDSGFTLAASSDPYIYNVSGTTFTSNEHQDRFLLVSGNYYGIVKNGTTTINTFIGLAAGVSIYGMDTILAVNDADLNITAKASNPISRIQIEQCTIDATSYTLNLTDSATVELRMRDCLFMALAMKIDGQSNKILFNRVHCSLSSNGIEDAAEGGVAMSYKFTSIRKSGAKAGNGVKLPTADRLFQDVYIENFEYAVFATNGKLFGNQSGTNVILDNCTYGFEVRNGTKLIFTLCNIYIDGIDYTFAATIETLSWNVNVFIDNLFGTPDTGTFHSSVDETVTDSSIDVYWLPFAPETGGAGYWDRSSAGVISPDTVGDTLSIDTINEEASGVGVIVEGVTMKDSYLVLAEVSTPGTPSANTGFLYMDDADEHIYFKNDSVTFDLTEVGGSGGLSWSGSGGNKVGTWVDADTIQAEDNLQFDGSVLTLAGTLSINDTNTQIWEDGSSNLTFKDSVTGTKTLAQLSTGGVTPAALTKTDDTNVTLTLGGAPATALLQATSLTLGWTGTLADGRIASAATWNGKSDISMDGNSTNGVITYGGVNNIDVESSLTFDGNILSVTDKIYLNRNVHGTEGLSIEVDGPNVSSGATNVDRGATIDLRQAYAISNGITDSGYRMGMNIVSTVNDTGFLGTLDEQFGIRIQYGSLSSSGAGTITDTYGLYLEHNSAGAATLTNVYSIYSTGAATMSHAGNVGISAAPSGSYELYVGGQIYSTGDMNATDFNLTSDPIWKDIYDEKIDGLGIVLQLKPILYKWKDRRNNFEHIGFSTEDVSNVRPELVKYDDNGYGMLSYAKITAINTAAIQDLNIKVETIEDRLRNRVFKLETRVKELEDGRST